MNLPTLDSIIEYGQEFNKEWIISNPNHFLSKTYEILHNKSIVFLSTSCEITAAMIKWKLGYNPEINWELVDEGTTFEEMYSKYNIFQITIGESWDDTEHEIMIVDGNIVQSYYGKYPITKNLLTPTIIRSLSLPLTFKKYATITRSNKCPNGIIFNGDIDKMKIHYWVPNIL